LTQRAWLPEWRQVAGLRLGTARDEIHQRLGAPDEVDAEGAERWHTRGLAVFYDADGRADGLGLESPWGLPGPRGLTVGDAPWRARRLWGDPSRIEGAHRVYDIPFSDHVWVLRVDGTGPDARVAWILLQVLQDPPK